MTETKRLNQEVHTMRNESTPEETRTVSDCCRLVPVAHLSLDLSEPIQGWEIYLAEQGIVVLVDDCGRPAITRSVFASMVREEASMRKLQSERAALAAAEMAQEARRTPVPVGRPAVEGAGSGIESMMMEADYVTPRDEFGPPKPNFLEDALAEGQRLQREEAENAAAEKNRLRDQMRKDLQ